MLETMRDIKRDKRQPIRKEYSNGNIVYILDGEWHREDGPAIITRSGNEHWYKHGKLHRLDGPARTYANPYGRSTYEYWVEDERVTIKEFEKHHDTGNKYYA
jgi:hypothetical protein